MNGSELIFGRKMSAEIAATTNEPIAGGGGGGAAGLVGRLLQRAARSALAGAHEMVTSQQQTSGYLAAGRQHQQQQQQQRQVMALDKIDNEQRQQEMQFQSLDSPAAGLMQLPLIQQQQQQPEQSFSEKWDDYWSKQPFPSGYTQSSIVLLACFISTIIFLIVVGNLLVCIAIFTEKSLRPTQNWFIASLAVSDMLLGALVMPGSLARELMGFWAFGPFWCDVHESIDVLLSTASINTLCLISLDRYWSITQAVSYLKKRTPRRGALMIAFVWIFSAAVSLPPLFGWKKESPTIRAAVNTNAAGHNSSQTRPPPPPPVNATHSSATETQDAERDRELESSAAIDDEQRARRRRRLQQSDNLFDSEQEAFLSNTMRPLLATQQQPLVPLQQLPPTSATSATSDPLDQQQIQEYPTCQLSDDVGYVLYSALGSFYIPCAVMVFTYIKIFLAARSRARRAINKQSRIGAAAGGTGADRAKRSGGRSNHRTPTPDRKQLIGSSAVASAALAGNALMSGGNGPPLKSAPGLRACDSMDGNDPMNQKPGLIKGKIVIVERKKSLANSLTANPQQQQQLQQLQSSQLKPMGETLNAQSHVMIETGDTSCQESASMIMHTSGAVVASPGVLSGQQLAGNGGGGQTATTGSLGGDSRESSSTITVMNPSMGELPVTRFNFQKSPSGASLPASEKTPAAESGCLAAAAATETAAEREAGDKAAALLRALSKVSETFSKGNADKLLDEVLVDSTSAATRLEGKDNEDEDAEAESRVPDIVVERRGTNVSGDRLPADAASEQQQITGAMSTNETCFMTIEEDSDMFDAQAGRTIMMVAGNRKQPPAGSNGNGKTQSGITMTMMPPTSANSTNAAATTCQQAAGVVVCNNVACQQRAQQRQATTTTTTTTTTTRSASSYCGSSMTINDDDIDDCVDDELLTDDCNGYSVSCGLDQYCSGASASNCPHCQEYEMSCGDAASGGQERDSPSGQQRAARAKDNHNQVAANPNRTSAHHHTIVGSGEQFRQKANNLSNNNNNNNNNNIDLEAQSLTGDDNLSLTEYRSNEDSSSIMGHDVLDATESHHRPQQPGDRKKSLIGFRLTRLGSNAPLTAHSGGLLALASNQQRQTQMGSTALAGATTGVGSAGTRNLKALRQNFFLKLNQLTAKSAAKQQRKANQMSPTGNKSSAPSSGTSYEPSVDCATTSNVHSTDYPQDTMIGEQTDYEQQTSSDNQHHHHHQQQQQQQLQQQQHQQHQQQQQQRFQTKMSGSVDGAAATIAGSASQGRGSRSNESRPNVDNEVDQVEASRSQDKTASAASTNDRALLLRAPNDDFGAKASSGNRSNLLASDSNLLPDDSSRASSLSKHLQVQQLKPGGQPNKRGTGGSQANRSATGTATAQGASGPTGKAYLASDNERHKRKLAKARERRATLILGIIMTAFICSWMPFFTFYVLRALCSVCRDYMTGYPKVEAFIFWMGYCNSAINPIIYTIFNRDFRKAFRKILFRCL